MPLSNIADVAFAIQTAKGSAASASAFRVYLSGGSSIEPTKPPELSRAVTSGRIALSAYTPTVGAFGQPECFVRPISIGALLYAVLGAKAVAGASDPFTHTLTIANSRPWLTFWRSVGGVIFERFVDCRVSTLTIRSKAGEPVRADFTVLGISPRSRTAAETTVAVEVADTFHHRHAAGALLVEGVAVAEIEEVTVQIDCGDRPRDTLLSYGVKAGPITSISAQVTQRLVSTALWNRLNYGASSPANDAAAVGTPLELAGSPAGLRLTWTEQASPERSLRLDLPRLVLADYGGLNPSVRAQPLTQAVTYRALKPASGSALTATLKNSRSAY